jgi:hypothetical protein
MHCGVRSVIYIVLLFTYGRGFVSCTLWSRKGVLLIDVGCMTHTCTAGYVSGIYLAMDSRTNCF